MARGVAQSLKARRRFSFRLADAADDAALRRLLRQTPMDGPVRVTLRREPSYFDAARVEGPNRQTLLAIDARDQRAVGMGTRSVRLRYVDGQATPVGYLSGLRILPEHRGGTLLARGYAEMRRLHEDGATDYYLTTIADGNRRALESLIRGRAELPSYFRLGKYHTFVLPVRRQTTRRRDPDLVVRTLRAQEFSAWIDFLRDVGSSRLFFPCYTAADFRGPQAALKELTPHNLLVAWRGSQIVASVALWDQRGFKQTIVEGYGPAVRYAGPAYNLLASLCGWPRFPAIGAPLEAIIAALPLVADGDAEVFAELLAAAARHARQRFPEVPSLLLGAFERDPLCGLFRRASLFRYVTHVFLAYWDEQLVRPERFAGRDLYLELGCL